MEDQNRVQARELANKVSNNSLINLTEFNVHLSPYLFFLFSSYIVRWSLFLRYRVTRVQWQRSLRSRRSMSVEKDTSAREKIRREANAWMLQPKRINRFHRSQKQKKMRAPYIESDACLSYSNYTTFDLPHAKISPLSHRWQGNWWVVFFSTMLCQSDLTSTFRRR